MDLASATPISPSVRQFLQQPNYATLATAGESGEPHVAVIWYGLQRDGRILVNSRAGRRWPEELRREPRCSLAVTDASDPFRWLGLQAIVDEIVDDVPSAREDIVALAQRYGEANERDVATFRRQQRVSFLLRIVRIHDHLEDD